MKCIPAKFIVGKKVARLITSRVEGLLLNTVTTEINRIEFEDGSYISFSATEQYHGGGYTVEGCYYPAPNTLQKHPKVV